MVGDVGRELTHRLAARALRAVHVERQPDRQRLDLVLLRKLGQHGEIGRQLAALQGRDWRRQHAQRVRSGDADGLAADIERHQAAVGHERLQFREVDDRHASDRLAVQPGGGIVGDPLPARLADHPVTLIGIFEVIRNVREARSRAAHHAGRRQPVLFGGDEQQRHGDEPGIDRRGLPVIEPGPRHLEQGAARIMHEACMSFAALVRIRGVEGVRQRLAEGGAVRLAPPAPLHLDAGERSEVRGPDRDHAGRRGGREQHPGTRQAAGAQQQRDQPAHGMADHDRLLRQGAQFAFEIGCVIEQAGDAERAGRRVRRCVMVA